MIAPSAGVSRFRAYLQFLAAVLFFFLARSIARHAAASLAGGQWTAMAEQFFLAVLLLLGYAGFDFVLNHEPHPMVKQGWPGREGWRAEAGLGLAFGWGMAVVCVLPSVLFGGVAIVLNLNLASWGWLAAGVLYFAFVALAEEVALRGYGFQRFAEATGPVGAALGYAAFYGIFQSMLTGATRASIASAVVLSLILSTAYLRTQALWVSWGLNFGWKASRALLFGLTVAGASPHTAVVEGTPMGSFWVTGGGYGLEGSWITLLLLLLAWPLLIRVTRELDYRYNAPILIAGGIPMEPPPLHTLPAADLVQIQPGAVSAQSQEPPPESV